MKRILVFSLTYHPFIGGAEVAIKEITDRIDPKEYAFDMITLRFDSNLPKFERAGNIDVFRIGFTRPGAKIADFNTFPLVLNKYLYPFWAFSAAFVLHRRKAYDMVASVMTSYASFAPLFFKMVFPKVPYLVRADDGDPIEYLKKRARIVKPLFTRVFTKADYAVTTSSYLERFVRGMGYAGPLSIVPNGVDAERFSRVFSEGEVMKMQEKIGKKQGEVYLVTTSRLVEKNAIDDVIRALTLVPKHVHFLVYGIGPDELPLKRLAQDLDVAERVHFAGQIGHAEMPLALRACDIFIRPSRSEGFGISFVEAMVVGVPVIATQEGGIADFLYDAKRNPKENPTGWAVDKDSPEQIAQAVQDILAHPEEVAQVKATARAMVLKRYDWGFIAQGMENVFDLALKTSSIRT